VRGCRLIACSSPGISNADVANKLAACAAPLSTNRQRKRQGDSARNWRKLESYLAQTRKGRK